jgi:hypothetical protein
MFTTNISDTHQIGRIRMATHPRRIKRSTRRRMENPLQQAVAHIQILSTPVIS